MKPNGNTKHKSTTSIFTYRRIKQKKNETNLINLAKSFKKFLTINLKNRSKAELRTTCDTAQTKQKKRNRKTQNY